MDEHKRPVYGLVIQFVEMSEDCDSRLNNFLMKHLKYANPTLDTPVYYRLNDKIYFEGGNDLFWDNGKINIWLVPADTKSISDLDDYPVPSDMIALILEHAETVGMRELQTLKDIVNDGDQPNLNEQ